MKYFLVASAFLLSAVIGGAQAQSIQLRKQTREIPLPAPAKPKPTAPVVFAALTATQLFNQASPSVVVVKATDKDGNVLATGSGVVVAHSGSGLFTVATNCHVVDTPGSDGEPVIRTDSGLGLGDITRRDTARDVCLVLAYLRKTDATGNFIKSDGRFVSLPAPSLARIAPLRSLKVGERVYAIGAPQGLELSLSEGLVSGLRKDGGTTLIQTTAAISKGSSGGGLFDEQGRLVGITTMFLEDSQALNFAVPAELIAPAIAAEAAASAAFAAAAAADAAVEKPAPPYDRWVEVASGDDGVTTYVDTQTLRRDGTDVTVWIKHTHDKPKKDKTGDVYDEAMNLSAYHCASRQYTKKVASQRLRGKLVWIHEYESYEQERKSVMPGTVGEHIMDVVCAQ